MRILGIIKANYIENDIPNKYTRVVNGYSVICFSIFALKYSKYVNDVVVFSDIDDVRKLAEKYGCKCLDSNSDFDDSSYDIVVSTKASALGIDIPTIDLALEYVFKNNIKTLNTLKDIFTIENRNGKGKELYELSKFELADLDDYKDFYCIHNKHYRTAFYVNGNNTRGTGHVYRVLDFCDDFYDKPDIYYDINQTEPSIFGNTLHNLIPVDGLDDLYNKIKGNKYDVFINDILQTTAEHITKLRHRMPNCRIINFEDDGPGSRKADLVFNALFDESVLGNIYGGEKYYTSDESLFMYPPIKIKEEVKRVFICFGGADPQNYSDRLLNIIANDDEYKKYEFFIALGPSKKNVENLLEYNCDNIVVKHIVKDLPGQMELCDIAITSRGTVAYELATLAVPTISIAQNDNERKHNFACKENGFECLDVNPSDVEIKQALDKYLNLTKKQRQDIADVLISLDLRHGRKRVMELINKF